MGSATSISATIFPSAGDCSDGDVRLIGGFSENEGRVEVCINRTYTAVCNDFDNFWDIRDASVVCRQLGYEGISMCVCIICINGVSVELLCANCC